MCIRDSFKGSATELAVVDRLDLVIGSGPELGALRQALAQRSGPIVQLRSQTNAAPLLYLETVTCIDTTAAGGNTELLGASTPAPASESEPQSRCEHSVAELQRKG